MSQSLFLDSTNNEVTGSSFSSVHVHDQNLDTTSNVIFKTVNATDQLLANGTLIKNNTIQNNTQDGTLIIKNADSGGTNRESSIVMGTNWATNADSYITLNADVLNFQDTSGNNIFGQSAGQHVRFFNNVDGDNASIGLGALDPNNSSYDCYINLKQDSTAYTNNICYRNGSKTANPQMIYSYNLGRLLVAPSGVSHDTIPNQALDIRGNAEITGNLAIDSIIEKTSNNGITIDGLSIKDNSILNCSTITMTGNIDLGNYDINNITNITIDNINEKIPANGVNIMGTTFQSNAQVNLDVIAEKTLNNGINIDGTIIKDNVIKNSIADGTLTIKNADSGGTNRESSIVLSTNWATTADSVITLNADVLNFKDTSGNSIFGQSADQHIRFFNNVDQDNASIGIAVLGSSNAAYDCYLNMKQDSTATTNNICYRNGSKTANPQMIYSYNLGRLLVAPSGVVHDTIPDDALDIRGNIQVRTSAPKIVLREEGVTADNGRYDILCDAEDFNIRLVDDADTTATYALRIKRTGLTADSFDVSACTTFIANDVNTNSIKITNYGTGSQSTAITDSVTINARSGEITTVTANTPANSTDEFLLLNSTYALTDLCFISLKSYVGTGYPVVQMINAGTGQIKISIRNVHPSEALNSSLKIQFLIVNTQ